MTKHKILTKSEIEAELKHLKDWSVKGPNIEASFEFKDFRDAISFIVQVAIEAEVINHHPEFYNSYNKVRFPFAPMTSATRSPTPILRSPSKISDIARRFLSMK